jgi:hypothetical protein
MVATMLVMQQPIQSLILEVNHFYTNTGTGIFTFLAANQEPEPAAKRKKRRIPLITFPA